MRWPLTVRSSGLLHLKTLRMYYLANLWGDFGTVFTAVLAAAAVSPESSGGSGGGGWEFLP